MQSVGRALGLPARSVFKDIEIVRSGSQFAVRFAGQLYPMAEHSPALASLLSRKSLEPKLDSTLFGPSPPNVFVGEYGFPTVFAGPLVSLDDSLPASALDNPMNWMNVSYEDIISQRASLVRGKRVLAARRFSGRYASDLQDTVLSKNSIDLELTFRAPPKFSLFFSPSASPMGPSGEVTSLTLAGNPVIPSRVDSLIEDKVRVLEAVPELLSAGFEYYYLQKLLSAGVLGAKPSLVPTKWSITATDDILAKHLLHSVRENPALPSVELYSNEAFGNHFEVLFLPGAFEYEGFEAWAPSTPWAQHAEPTIVPEYEPHEGRTRYAEGQGGGYYAARLACVEHLHARRKQARTLVFREISEAYSVPLGVAQVRENVRAALRSPPAKPNSLQDAFSLLSLRLHHPLSAYRSLSRILNQQRLTDY